jgi:hypothetical protein
MSSPRTDCIEHGYPTDYPYIRVNGKLVNGQRLVWQLKHGRKMPQGMKTRHTCDNPRCINPEHLLSGTQQQNIGDAKRRGRWKPNGVDPVSDLERSQILGLVLGGLSYRAAARQTGRSATTVRRIVNGK